MCGIVGLFLKDPSLEPHLGSLTETMLATLSDRGPDSAGFAVYGEGRSGETKLTLRGSSAEAMKETAERIGRAFSDANIMLYDTHAVVGIDDRLGGETRRVAHAATRRPSRWSDAASAWRCSRRWGGRRR